jgi:hypothetical protein
VDLKGSESNILKGLEFYRHAQYEIIKSAPQNSVLGYAQNWNSKSSLTSVSEII